MTKRKAAMHTWQLQEAKSKFNKAVANAIHDGPQLITKHGTEVAVVLSVEEYRKLTVSPKKLSDFFQESPLAGADLGLARTKAPFATPLYELSPHASIDVVKVKIRFMEKTHVDNT
jgi:prevent-host-death family protein